ncbi:enoyl-[acyl-carrier protein] reductase / trans-2-enoyl-CoA reductase (NAD+) [Rubritalea squalenifaciens DSM 18772]|uniref:Enoyl-[acyl-carrier-protein] reductase [NADH] n=1 Tax=Rubritalea squalenifaciens DSM 18772 TaxID=1123071 RepID=A0A1M6PP81_9BACT|nr:enoyl-ACP reductase FabV [Rubritalea squalenifaciens]SHK09753.1 enoyl-[acyl-carrier protein] reductase / trans-2-enoyl-CoA reductase (NAD+) [Rubritalea squalenifaciens DSM 18772]
MIVSPKIRGFICTTAHPDGCAAHVQEQIDYVKSKPKLENGPKNVLVIGASTGYGLASRIVPAFASGANTLGLFFEKPGSEKRTGSAGWYNSAAFEKAATAEGLFAKSLNGDAFSHEMKAQAVDIIKNEMGGKIDLVVYSLASPRRTDPDTGEVYKSVLKTTGGDYTNKTLNTDKGEVEEVTIGAATPEEIEHTIKVMGGEDWELWMNALSDAGVLADGVKTVAYSYIGPELTWPIYTDGTIGQAKKDLEKSCAQLNEKLSSLNGEAYVSVNKALVTQASSAIPVVPLYISILYKEMKEKGLHEGCIEQIERLFADRLYSGDAKLDEAGRIRIDDWEMRDDIQSAVAEKWKTVSNENFSEIADFQGYQDEFLKLFGFGLEGVNYEADTDPATGVPSIAE